MVEVARRFGVTMKRREILRGLLRYRAELRRVGIARAFQWLDGSFVENISREPNDVDIVTFSEQQPVPVAPADLALFRPHETKTNFLCDAYFVHLGITDRSKLIERATYWYGLFSHRRGSFEWKGLIQVGVDDPGEDHDALNELSILEVMAS